MECRKSTTCFGCVLDIVVETVSSLVGSKLDWRLSLCWENSRKRSTTTFNQRDKYFFCIYCIHKLFKLTFAYMFSVISDL